MGDTITHIHCTSAQRYENIIIHNYIPYTLMLSGLYLGMIG